MRIFLSRPDITRREIELVNQVLQGPQLSGGPFLERFEQGIARYVGTRWAVGVSNGTCGLHFAVKVAGLKEGDEVITTPFSFVASANCILYERARPVFVDIEPRSLNMDVNLIVDAITPRTRAILPVHVFGHPCPMDEILSIARRHRLLVIEDACEALGAEYDGRKVGTFGDCAVFAFYPNKQMTTGEGGVIVTDNEEFAKAFRSLRNQGRDDDGTWLRHVRLGYNYRLSELSAALGVAQLERVDELLTKRAKVAHWYTQRLRDREGIEVPCPPERGVGESRPRDGSSGRARCTDPAVFPADSPPAVLRERARLPARGVPGLRAHQPLHARAAILR